MHEGMARGGNFKGGAPYEALYHASIHIEIETDEIYSYRNSKARRPSCIAIKERTEHEVVHGDLIHVIQDPMFCCVICS
jgi:hypothetical protein